MTSKEDEFASRDKMGLEAIDQSKQPSKTETQTRRMYLVVNSVITFLVAPLLAAGLLGLARRAFPLLAEQHNTRVALLRRYDVGWLYASWYVLSAARAYATINANGARVAARVGRPDQHAYRIMSRSGQLSDAPYVLMENVGPVGRFNRAQRAAFHMDEGLELLVVGILLAGVVIPRLIFVLAVAYATGRVYFTNAYTGHLDGRIGAIVFWAVPQHLITAFVGIFAVQAFTPSL